MAKFAGNQTFSILFSSPSAPDDVKTIEKNCSSFTEARDFYQSDEVSFINFVWHFTQIV